VAGAGADEARAGEPSRLGAYNVDRVENAPPGLKLRRQSTIPNLAKALKVSPQLLLVPEVDR